MNRTPWALAGSLALALAVGAPAQASITVYSSRAAFEAAVPGATVETFDEVAAPTTILNGTSFNGVTYTSSTGNPLITSGFTPLSPPNTLGEDVNGYFAGSDTITFTFPNPVTAFGVSINTTDNGTGVFTATDDLGNVVGSSFDPFPGLTTGEFIGYTSTLAFTTETIAAPGGSSFTLDDLSYFPPNVVPEPSTICLAGLGALCLAGYRIRRRRRMMSSLSRTNKRTFMEVRRLQFGHCPSSFVGSSHVC